MLIGIVSRGTNYCVGNNITSPSVFVRVSAIADWLIEFVPPVISGPTVACAAGILPIFSIPRLPPNASVRWEADAPLSVAGTGVEPNEHIVWIRHSGAATPMNSQVRAVIYVNNIRRHIVRHNVVVNRPVIHSIQGPDVIRTRSSSLFTVNHTGGAVSWNVSPDIGVHMLPLGDNLHISFGSFVNRVKQG